MLTLLISAYSLSEPPSDLKRIRHLEPFTTGLFQQVFKLILIKQIWKHKFQDLDQTKTGTGHLTFET